ncbi:MAG: hydrolase, partial [Chitinophagaceae bacterium]
DKQVINLDRYELFFPEKRQFFLENGDQINNFGYPSLRPFFSRRIGLGVPIEFGGRLSGKLNRNWRISLMDMKTAKQEGSGLPSQNFTVFALQRKVFARSNIGILMVNKQSLNSRDSAGNKYSLYNRNLGLEYNLASSNNLWTGKAVVLKSFSPGRKGDDLSNAANLQYSSKQWLINGAYEYAGRHYNAEVGYVPRQGYVKFNPQVSYFFFPKHSSVLTHGPQLISTYFFDPSFHKTDDETQLSYLITFRNKATLAPGFIHDYVELLFPFDPTNNGRFTLAKGSRHNYNSAGAEFISKPQSLFTYRVAARYGSYFADGRKLTLSADIGYRFQPILNLLLTASYNNLDLPFPWSRSSFWIVGPKVDLTMTNKLFFTTYVQYNQQLKNTNINARFQWRYRPASDLFLVYTDNYLDYPFSVRSRALVLKFNYWWGL